MMASDLETKKRQLSSVLSILQARNGTTGDQEDANEDEEMTDDVSQSGSGGLDEDDVDVDEELHDAFLNDDEEF